MAHYTIIVEGPQLVDCVSPFHTAGLDLGNFVLVFVVPEMRRELACFVLTIARRRSPGKLEREQDEQEDRQPAAHLKIVSVTRDIAATSRRSQRLIV